MIQNMLDYILFLKDFAAEFLVQSAQQINHRYF